MKMKEFGPPGGGRASLAPPLRSANAINSEDLSNQLGRQTMAGRLDLGIFLYVTMLSEDIVAHW